MNFGPKDAILDGGGAEHARRVSRSKNDRPGEKAPPLLDQLNRIDMLGFNRFVEAIAMQEQLAAMATPRSAAGSPRGKKNQMRSPRPATSDNPPSFALGSSDKGFVPATRRGITPEASSTASGVTASTSRPHPPTAPSSTAMSSGAPTQRTLHPGDGPRTHVTPTRPSTTPHSQGANPHRNRAHKSKPDVRTRTYTTGHGGDEEIIIVKMGQKDMALDENAPPVRRVSDGGATLTESFDEKSEGQTSNVSTDFGSVHFEPNKADKAKAYHNVKGAGDENWCSADLYRHNPVFDTDQIKQVFLH